MASFKDAFRAARSAGKTTFKWQGKSYHTKTKDEMSKVQKKVPTPTARPDPTATGSIPKPTPKPSQKARAAADYPRPAKAVGIAKAGSAISKAAARQENSANRGANAFATALIPKKKPTSGGGGGW